MDILDFWSLDMTNNKSQKKLRPKQSKIWIKTNNPTKIKIVIAIKVSKMMSKKYSYVVQENSVSCSGKKPNGRDFKHELFVQIDLTSFYSIYFI